VHEHPLIAYKYLQGGTVRVVISPVLKKVICTTDAEKSVVHALKSQFKGRLHETDLCSIGFFNYKNIKLAFLVQAVLKSDEKVLSDDMFDTENNVFWLIISTARGLKKYHKNRIQKVKTKKEKL